jgi:hypothetical protein
MKNYYFKKSLTVILLLAVIFSCVAFNVSCAKDNAANDTNKSDDKSPVDSGGVKDAETTTEVSFDPGLPEANYGGIDFRILNINQESMWWAIVDVDYAEQNGDVVNDAVYMRNRNIEDKYNFLVKEIKMSTAAVTSAIRKSVGAGSDDYDIALPYTTEIPALVQNNTLYNLNTIPHLDFNKPWWNNNIQQYFSIDNKLLFAMSDLILTDNDDVVITMYNKKLAEDLGIDGADYLYNLVDEGKWTFEKFTELVKAGSADLNGNGKVDAKEDRFGLVCVNWCYMALVGGFGESLISKDAEDLPYIACKTERFINAYQTMAEFMSRRDWVVREGADPIGENGRTEVVFVNDRALMCIQVLSCCRLYKDMGSDFGVLPMPKLDEAQDRYYSYMCGSTCITVPKTNTDLDKTGLILEALSAESRRLVVPAYYEVALSAKYLRDEGSYRMLDIILDGRVHEINEIFNWGGLSGAINNLAQKADPNVMSAIEKVEPKVITAIQKTIDAYNNVD